MTHSFYPDGREDFPAISRYKYLVQDEDLEEFTVHKPARRAPVASRLVDFSDPDADRPWPLGFMAIFVGCVSILLWIWIYGAVIWLKHHLG